MCSFGPEVGHGRYAETVINPGGNPMGLFERVCNIGILFANTFCYEDFYPCDFW